MKSLGPWSSDVMASGFELDSLAPESMFAVTVHVADPNSLSHCPICSGLLYGETCVSEAQVVPQQRSGEPHATAFCS